MRRTRNAKIVATLGPASADHDTIRDLFEAGADVFRLNFSHGTHEDHKQRFDIIRAIEREVGRPIAVLIDLQGPKLRVGTFANGSVQLAEGASFRLDLDRDKPGDQTRAPLPHPEIFNALTEGTDLLLDDGRVCLRVERCGPEFAETRVIAGGMLSDRKGVNVPGVVLPLSALTQKDRVDLDYGLTLGVDWIALSFVQRARDIVEIKEIVKGRAGIVAKLEKPAAIGSLDEIVGESDAVMVARGDLGVEMPLERVPMVQKRAVTLARERAKPVIVATQMLDSMIHHSRPTRAEASDVANAVLDGADALMLSGETSVGEYARDTVSTMARIIETAEAQGPELPPPAAGPEGAAGDAIAAAAVQVARDLDARALVAFTQSGGSARRLARHRSPTPLLAFTTEPAVRSRLSLVWGVETFVVPHEDHTDGMIRQVDRALLELGRGAPGDRVVIVAGTPPGAVGSTNMVRVHRLGEA